MSSMSSVYVLGAGASRAESAEIPIVSDFLSKAFNLGKFSSPDATSFIQAISSRFGLDVGDLKNGSVDIEQVFTLIDTDIAWEEHDRPDGVSWLRSSIARSTIEGLLGGVLFPVMKAVLVNGAPLHKRLVERTKPGDSILTFNYDLIIDKALLDTNKFTRSGYCIEFSGGVDSSSERLHKTPTDAGQSEVKLLKLHGSLNWLGYHYPKKTRILYLEDGLTTLNLAAEGWGPSIQLKEEGDYDGYLKPLLVPPSSDKSHVWETHNGAMRGLWVKAGEALQECATLFVLGYSLRDADYQARWLFRRFLADRQDKPQIWVVNSNPDHRCRLRSFFRSLGAVVESYSFEDFVG